MAAGEGMKRFMSRVYTGTPIAFILLPKVPSSIIEMTLCENLCLSDPDKSL
jgi:hypothetical protein